jgi:tetratricopeptide (TPR) repeat protein
MSAVVTERIHLIKWTRFMLAFVVSILSLVNLCLLALFLMAPKHVNTLGIILLMSFCGGLALWMYDVRKRLVKGDEFAWGSAIAIAVLNLPSIAFPFAVLSLIELTNKSKRSDYFSKTEPQSFSFEANPSTFAASSVPNNTLKAILITAVLILALATGIVWLSNSGGKLALKTYAVNPSLSVQQLWSQGARCNSNGDMTCSEAVFNRLLELDPSDNGALANLAMAESRLGEHDQALKHFDSYFTHGGRGVDAMFLMAKSLNAVGKKSDSLVLCDRALKESSNLIDVAQFKARLMLELGQFTEAATFLDAYLVKYPTAKSYLQGLREEAEARRHSEKTVAI